MTGPASDTHRAIEAVFRIESPRLIAGLARIVRDVLRSGPEAVRAAKRLTLGEPADGQELARIAAGLRAGPEGQEGLRAFLEKRPARQAD